MSSKTLLVLLLVGVLVSTFFTADAYPAMDNYDDALEDLDNLDLDDYFDLEPADFVLLDMWANMLESSDFDDLD
uniref:Venom anionic peptide-2 n=1 Tax=Mesobuthus eupeus TaxID=34648 RepID=E4VNZ6_MESEU|nr:venom anionic peptide-2 [Mesobuthus eupeus]